MNTSPGSLWSRGQVLATYIIHLFAEYCTEKPSLILPLPPGPNFIKMCLPGRRQLVPSGWHILFFIKLDYGKGINYGWCVPERTNQS